MPVAIAWDLFYDFFLCLCTQLKKNSVFHKGWEIIITILVKTEILALQVVFMVTMTWGPLSPK